LYDVSGSYRLPYSVAAGLCVIGVVFLAAAGPATVSDSE
jgi:hypothetical protein